MELKNHLIAEFTNSLPAWVDRNSIILKAIRDSIILKIESFLLDFKQSTDIFISGEAKSHKLEDFNLSLNPKEAGFNFKDIRKLIFRRGSKSSLHEIALILKEQEYTPLSFNTELNKGKELKQNKRIKVSPSTEITSGWIADVTHPGIDSDTFKTADDKCDFIFSEEYFLLAEVVNTSDMSNSAFKDLLMRFHMPAFIPTIIKFKKEDEV